MKIIGVIPARYNSTRFPGKPLVKIKGQFLIERVWRRAIKSKRLNELVIATDDHRIRQAAINFGAKSILTSTKCKTGTDRVSEIADHFGKSNDIFINIQGDEPLISSKLIDELASALIKNIKIDIATAAYRIKNEKMINNPNVVKVVLDNNNFALYFSRHLIPYNRSNKSISYYKHLGIYAYRKTYLLKFTKLKQTSNEKAEMLEQLRAIDNGHKIKVVISKTDSVGIDVPADIKTINELI